MENQDKGFQFRGTLTEQQYRRVQWLASGKLILGFISFLLVVLIMNLASGGAKVIIRDPVINLARLAPIIALVLFLFIAPRWQARRNYRASPTLRGEISGTIM